MTLGDKDTRDEPVLLSDDRNGVRTLTLHRQIGRASCRERV
jgi:hypothetical protein